MKMKPDSPFAVLNVVWTVHSGMEGAKLSDILIDEFGEEGTIKVLGDTLKIFKKDEKK